MLPEYIIIICFIFFRGIQGATFNQGAETGLDIKLTCGPLEEYSECVPACWTDDTCEFLLYGSVPNCMELEDFLVCSPKCRCKEGYARIEGNCVPVDECCTRADPNTQVTDCPRQCDDSCLVKSTPDCEGSPCLKIGCACKPGFVRANLEEESVCIKEKYCDPLL